jgi:transposase InsO family protein
MSKIRQQEDGTLSRNNTKYMLMLIETYEAIKAKKHPKFKFVSEFYKCYKLTRQNFIKYYNRFKSNHDPQALLPQKRGSHKTSRFKGLIEEKVIQLRQEGYGRQDIFLILKEQFIESVPSPSTIYNITKWHNINRLVPKQKSNRRRIIKEKAGELGHMDCHYLPKGLIQDDHQQYYLVAIIDDASRIAWANVVTHLKALNVMFAALKVLNLLNTHYHITFLELMTDNGAEFGSGPKAQNKDSHPFEMMLSELGIKHLYTRPYRPQTNGKIERFWRTLNMDLLDDVVFDNLAHFKDELQKYLLYYNELRPHQSLNGKTPMDFSKFCHRID